MLLDYLLVEGYPQEEFKVLSSWPRKDVIFFLSLIFFYVKIFIVFSSILFQLTAVDSTESLRQLKLVPQETLIIEER